MNYEISGFYNSGRVLVPNDHLPHRYIATVTHEGGHGIAFAGAFRNHSVLSASEIRHATLDLSRAKRQLLKDLVLTNTTPHVNWQLDVQEMVGMILAVLTRDSVDPSLIQMPGLLTHEHYNTLVEKDCPPFREPEPSLKYQIDPIVYANELPAFYTEHAGCYMLRCAIGSDQSEFLGSFEPFQTTTPANDAAYTHAKRLLADDQLPDF